MDTSDEYINMCRHAKELQSAWKPTRGDWYDHNPPYRGVGCVSDPLLVCDPLGNACVTWLPRLDQLLELFCHTREFKGVLRWQDIEIVKHVLSLYGPAHFNRIDLSLEKFFLMMLMEGGFGLWKWWDGEDWK